MAGVYAVAGPWSWWTELWRSSRGTTGQHPAELWRRLTWAEKLKLTLREGKEKIRESVGLYICMCKATHVWANVCGSQHMCGEVTGLEWGCWVMRWLRDQLGMRGREFVLMEATENRGWGVSSVLIWICMSVAWIWVRTLGPVFSMLTVWGLNSESAYIPAWTQHVGLVVSLFSPLPFCLSLGPFFPLLPPPHLSLYFFFPFCAKSSFLSSFLCLCIFFPFLTPGFPPPPLCFFMLSFSLSVTHGLLFSPPLFYFTLSVLLTK